MPRILKENQTAQIFDARTEQTIEVEFKNPEYPKYTEYSLSLFPHANSPEPDLTMIPQVRVDFGKELITAIPDNYFCDPEGKVISSNPESPDYRADWKELLYKYAPELLAQLSAYVFETTQFNYQRRFDAAVNGARIKVGEKSKKKTGSTDK